MWDFYGRVSISQTREVRLNRADLNYNRECFASIFHDSENQAKELLSWYLRSEGELWNSTMLEPLLFSSDLIQLHEERSVAYMHGGLEDNHLVLA
jgi:hypothetical protein